MPRSSDAKTSLFKWTTKRDKAALALADGYTEMQAADMAGVSRRTIQRWKKKPEFSLEVDRLTVVTGLASKAGRIQIAKRAARQNIQDAGIKTKRDLLDWLRFLQGETDGISLNITAIFEDAVALAGGGSEGDSGADQG